MKARGAATVSLAAADGDEAEDVGDDAEDVGDEADDVGDDAVDVGDDAVDVGDDAEDEGDDAVDVGDDAVDEPWLADEPVSLLPPPPPPPPQACSSDRPAHSNAWRHGKVVAGLMHAAASAGNLFGMWNGVIYRLDR